MQPSPNTESKSAAKGALKGAKTAHFKGQNLDDFHNKMNRAFTNGTENLSEHIEIHVN